MRKLLAAALLATTIFVIASPTPTISDATAAQHNALTDALAKAGIKLYLDADICRTTTGLAGYYHSPSKSLVLCNKGSKQMTEENLDTLRHEAIHAIQDCKNGVQGDRILQPVLKPGVARNLASQHGIDLERIRQVYSSRNVDQAVINLEYEAFAAAAGMSANTIATALRTTCSVR